MNKNIVWWVLGIVIVLVGVSMFMKKTPDTTLQGDGVSNEVATEADGTNPPTGTVKKTTTKSTNTPPSSILPTTQLSLKQIVAVGRGQKCSFVDTTTTVVVSGTVFTSGGKVRADYAVPGYGNANSHMISLGNDVYVWQDAMTTGSKSAVGSADSASSKPGVHGLSLNRVLGYKCEEWTADASKFVLPQSVVFSPAQ